jgi:hypothetical protein
MEFIIELLPPGTLGGFLPEPLAQAGKPAMELEVLVLVKHPPNL